MTKQEIEVKTKEKMQKIQDLMKELEITISAEEILNEKGMLRKVVYYMDNENYPLDKEEKND